MPCEKPFKITRKTFKIGFGTGFERAGIGNVRDSCLGICAWLILWPGVWIHKDEGAAIMHMESRGATEAVSILHMRVH